MAAATAEEEGVPPWRHARHGLLGRLLRALCSQIEKRVAQGGFSPAKEHSSVPVKELFQGELEAYVREEEGNRGDANGCGESYEERVVRR